MKSREDRNNWVCVLVNTKVKKGKNTATVPDREKVYRDVTMMAMCDQAGSFLNWGRKRERDVMGSTDKISTRIVG